MQLVQDDGTMISNTVYMSYSINKWLSTVLWCSTLLPELFFLVTTQSTEMLSIFKASLKNEKTTNNTLMEIERIISEVKQTGNLSKETIFQGCIRARASPPVLFRRAELLLGEGTSGKIHT